jgi:hypothetical protein
MSSIVQQKLKIVNTASSTWNITFDNPVTAGNFVALGVFVFDTNGSTEGVGIEGGLDNLSVAADNWGGTGPLANENSFYVYWRHVAGGATTYSAVIQKTSPPGVLTPSKYAIGAVEIVGQVSGDPTNGDSNGKTLRTGTTQSTPAALSPSGNNIILGFVCSENSTGSIPFSAAAGMTLLNEVDDSGQYNQIALAGLVTHVTGSNLSYNFTTTGSSITYGEVYFNISMTGSPSFGTVIPPTVTACTPSRGTILGGTAVTNLAGTLFASGAAVKFGGVAATSVVVVSPTQITCVTPVHAAGAVDVVVTNADSGVGTLVQGYAYCTPTAVSVVGVPDPSVFTTPVTFTVSVSDIVQSPPVAMPTPTGTVTLFDGGTQLISGLPLAAGVAQFIISDLNTGMHTITATFNPLGNFLASTGSAVQAVTPLSGLWTNGPFPNRLALYCAPQTGPYISPALGAFDPRRDMQFYVDGDLLNIVSFSFDAVNNRYLMFSYGAFNLQGVVQGTYHAPSPAFLSSATGATAFDKALAAHGLSNVVQFPGAPTPSSPPVPVNDWGLLVAGISGTPSGAALPTPGSWTSIATPHQYAAYAFFGSGAAQPMISLTPAFAGNRFDGASTGGGGALTPGGTATTTTAGVASVSSEWALYVSSMQGSAFTTEPLSPPWQKLSNSGTVLEEWVQATSAGVTVSQNFATTGQWASAVCYFNGAVPTFIYQNGANSGGTSSLSLPFVFTPAAGNSALVIIKGVLLGTAVTAVVTDSQGHTGTLLATANQPLSGSLGAGTQILVYLIQNLANAAETINVTTSGGAGGGFVLDLYELTPTTPAPGSQWAALLSLFTTNGTSPPTVVQQNHVSVSGVNSATAVFSPPVTAGNTMVGFVSGVLPLGIGPQNLFAQDSNGRLWQNLGTAYEPTVGANVPQQVTVFTAAASQNVSAITATALAASSTVFGTPAFRIGNAHFAPAISAASMNTALADLIVVSVGWDQGTVTGVADTAGNTYVPLTSYILGFDGGLGIGQMFYCLSATHASAANVVTATFSFSINNVAFINVWDVPITGATPTLGLGVPPFGSNGIAHTSSFSTTGSNSFVAFAGFDASGSDGYAAAGFTFDGNGTTFGAGAHTTFSSPQTNITVGFSAGAGAACLAAVFTGQAALTVTANNTFQPGNTVVLAGTAEAYLNGQTVTVLTASPAQFTANFSHSAFANPSDTGTASLAATSTAVTVSGLGSTFSTGVWWILEVSGLVSVSSAVLPKALIGQYSGFGA